MFGVVTTEHNNIVDVNETCIGYEAAQYYVLYDMLEVRRGREGTGKYHV
jgi:hypothetical protein